MLIAENVTKNFKQGREEVHAVRNIDLKVEEGERVYIHGRSGAGKSTLLHMLGALSSPSFGKISFRGKDVYRMRDAKRSRIRNRHFGFIFQFYYLLSELTVLENVMLPALIKGGRSKSEIRSSAIDLLEAVEMTERQRHRPSQISGGEAQRTAIARALVNSPDVLFCDEPTGNLDSEMSAEIYRTIRQLSEVRRMSVVLVSHQGAEEFFFDSEYSMTDGGLESVRVSERQRVRA